MGFASTDNRQTESILAKMPTRLELIVPEDLAASRLDRALHQLIPDRSRSSLARLIDEGEVLINGSLAGKASQQVEAGDQITVSVPEARAVGIEAQAIDLEIVFQDDDLVVVNKPAGLVVHPAAGNLDGTLVNALLHHIKDLSGIGGEIRPGIVHRLDKDTSGLMVVAKNDFTHRALKESWGTEAVRKEYLALVYGTPKASQGTIDAPIGRDPRERKRMAVVKDGREAVTVWKVEARYSYVTLIRCLLRTGRTHQIRVHLKHLGHPIVGDKLYAGPQWKGVPDRTLQRVIASMPRQALHAARLSFPHPRTGAAMMFEAELPPDIQNVLTALRTS